MSNAEPIRGEVWLIRVMLLRCVPVTMESAMKVHFDEQADGLYIRLDEFDIVESEEVHPG